MNAANSTPGNWLGPEGPHRTSDDAPRCTARAKSTGEQCDNFPMHGSTVCRVHGGKAKQVREAAQRRLAAEKLDREMRDVIAFESREGVADPFEALSLLADEALAMKEALASRVNSLKKLRYSAHGTGTEQLRAEVALYERAMDRAGKFLDLLVRNGFEERRVRMSEQMGLQVASLLRNVLAELGHDVSPGSETANLCARHLRAMSTVKGEVVR